MTKEEDRIVTITQNLMELAKTLAPEIGKEANIDEEEALKEAFNLIKKTTNTFIANLHTLDKLLKEL